MRKRCLVIDDDAVVRVLLRHSLQAAGFDIVAEAATRAEALDAASSVRPDLVLVDLLLAGDDGLVTIGDIRAILSDAVIVVVSGLPAREMEAACLQAGADHYAGKSDLIDFGRVLAALLAAGSEQGRRRE
jgi:DNA-binding NarL/FixJ family response regulator